MLRGAVIAQLYGLGSFTDKSATVLHIGIQVSLHNPEILYQKQQQKQSNLSPHPRGEVAGGGSTWEKYWSNNVTARLGLALAMAWWGEPLWAKTFLFSGLT